MTNLPPGISSPPFGKLVDNFDKQPGDHGEMTQAWRHWCEELFLRVGSGTGKPIVGDVAVYETTVGQADLASAATVILLDAKAGETWKIREIFLSGAGTNFSGGGGDRLLSVSDGTSTWTVIPAATLQSLAVARWGDAGTPFPATAAHLTAASAVGIDIVAAYSGGATDYTAGSLTLVIVAERTA